MEYIVFYLVVMLIQIDVEACICYCMKRKLNVKASFFLSLFWPVTVPIGIIYIARVTRKFPDRLGAQ